MAVVAMASVMTSCNNDEADFIEQPAPAPVQQQEPAAVKPVVEEVFDGNIYFSAYPEQLACINEDYEVKVGEEVIKVNVETLEVAKQYPHKVNASLMNAERLNRTTGTKFVEPNIYVFHIPAQMKGQVSVTPMWTVKEGQDAPECINTTYGIATNLDCFFHYNETESEHIADLINLANTRTFDDVAMVK